MAAFSRTAPLRHPRRKPNPGNLGVAARQQCANGSPSIGFRAGARKRGSPRTATAIFFPKAGETEPSVKGRENHQLQSAPCLRRQGLRLLITASASATSASMRANAEACAFRSRLPTPPTGMACPPVFDAEPSHIPASWFATAMGNSFISQAISTPMAICVTTVHHVHDGELPPDRALFGLSCVTRSIRGSESNAGYPSASSTDALPFL